MRKLGLLMRKAAKLVATNLIRARYIFFELWLVFELWVAGAGRQSSDELNGFKTKTFYMQQK